MYEIIWREEETKRRYTSTTDDQKCHEISFNLFCFCTWQIPKTFPTKVSYMEQDIIFIGSSNIQQLGGIT